MNKNRLFEVAALFSAASVFSVFGAVETPYEVGSWANFCQGAVSHTFDDNTGGQTSVAQPIFDAKGFHMTLFTVTGSMNPNWSNLNKAFAKGHEIASHSVTHPQTMSDNECGTSQTTIKQKVAGEPCITVAYPNCNIPNPQTQLKQCYIAGRICDSQIASKTPADFYRISAIMAGSAGVNTTNGFNDKANQAATNGGWLVWCHHGVGNDGHGYSNTATAALQGNIDFLYENRGKIWTETFGNVARYIKERTAASVTQKSSDDHSFTISVTDNLVDSIFNYPLTIRRPLPDGWVEGDVIVTQDGEEVEDTVVTVSGKKYIMFKAIPDGGDVIISDGANAVLRGSSRIGNGFQSPVIVRQNSMLMIDHNQFNGSELTVTICNLNGRVLSRYTLAQGRSSITLPMDKISQSAFIAKISGGGKTYIETIMPQM